MSTKPLCPRCMSSEVAVERRIDGDFKCSQCGETGKVEWLTYRTEPEPKAKGKTLTITTTYSDFDDEWLEWYLFRLENEDVLPGSKIVSHNLRMHGYVSFSSSDPTSPTKAVTEYKLDQGD